MKVKKYYQGNKSTIKKLMLLKEKLQAIVKENQEVFIAHSSGFYSVVIENQEGEGIKEAYYFRLGKLKSTSVNSTFIEKHFLKISSQL